MKAQYHRQITVDALGRNIESAALESIITANLGQDALRYQFGHDHFHYDSNSFSASNAYVDDLRRDVLSVMRQENVLAARASFGRLTHTVQDFYAHSNYVSLWRERFPAAPVQSVEAEIPELLTDPRLRSGRLYYPLELLSFIPALRPLVLPWLPRDSHAWMNLDEPARPGFELAFAAAVKRTQAEYLRVAQKLTHQQAILFCGNVPAK